MLTNEIANPCANNFINFQEKFATKCTKCKKIMTTGGVTFKNEAWHRECFTCANCNTQLAGQKFASRNDQPYCANCFGELFAKRCTSCSKPITGKIAPIQPISNFGTSFAFRHGRNTIHII